MIHNILSGLAYIISTYKVIPQMTVINASAAVTPLEQRSEKNSGSERDLNPRPLRCWCNALPTELSKPHESGCVRVSPLDVDVILGPSKQQVSN